MFVSILVDGLGATIDVGALAPKIAAEGSFFGLVTVALRSRYKFGASRPAVAAAMTLTPKKVPELQAVGIASADDEGEVSSSV
ncbi:unnamed protein product, partial [Symbiodinium pilosum]